MATYPVVLKLSHAIFIVLPPKPIRIYIYSLKGWNILKFLSIFFFHNSLVKSENLTESLAFFSSEQKTSEVPDYQDHLNPAEVLSIWKWDPREAHSN